MADLGNLNLSSMSGAERETLMGQVQQQMAIANAQALIEKLSQKCVKPCIGKPGTSLGSSEKQCLSRCMDRFMEAWNLVSGSYQERLRNETYSSMQ